MNNLRHSNKMINCVCEFCAANAILSNVHTNGVPLPLRLKLLLTPDRCVLMDVWCGGTFADEMLTNGGTKKSAEGPERANCTAPEGKQQLELFYYHPSTRHNTSIGHFLLHLHLKTHHQHLPLDHLNLFENTKNL